MKNTSLKKNSVPIAMQVLAAGAIEARRRQLSTWVNFRKSNQFCSELPQNHIFRKQRNLLRNIFRSILSLFL